MAKYKKINISIKQGDTKCKILIAEEFTKKDIAECFKFNKFSNIFIISDDNVSKLYAPSTMNNFIGLSSSLHLIKFPPGEKSKNQTTVNRIYEILFKNKCNRDSLIISLGGGVVGDISGFVASTYMRGLSFVQIPTTFLGMVDSSIGGKNGINTNFCKNMIGCFCQPMVTIINTSFLKTLPNKETINGWMEAIKIFLTNDKKYFKFLNKNEKAFTELSSEDLAKIIYRAVREKTKIVKNDPFDRSQRTILNFGHTIGHALEKITDYRLSHGQAVGIGILVESKISQLIGILSDKNYDLIERCLLLLGINLRSLDKMDIKDMLQAMESDKKNDGKNLRFVILKDIGKIMTKNNKYTFPIDKKVVERAWNYITKKYA